MDSKAIKLNQLQSENVELEKTSAIISIGKRIQETFLRAEVLNRYSREKGLHRKKPQQLG